MTTGKQKMSRYETDLQSIKTELVRMNQHLKDRLPQIEKDIALNYTRLNSHSNRITLLEQWQYKAIGISVGTMALIGIALHFLG